MSKARLITLIVAFLLAVSAMAVVWAAPGPNGSNDYGLCRAYFAGGENGRENKRDALPFQNLEEAADDGNGQTSPEEDVREYCEGVTNPGGKGWTPAPGQDD